MKSEDERVGIVHFSNRRADRNIGINPDGPGRRQSNHAKDRDKENQLADPPAKSQSDARTCSVNGPRTIFLANGKSVSVSTDMAKTDKQPDGPGGIGREKESEVTGRGKGFLYTCWNDGAGNYVDPNWEWFTCWRCGVTVNSKTGETRIPQSV
jgi:hypothetical protein